MGNQKVKWTTEEEDALLAGIAKHGAGKWKNILRDPEFAPHLTHRSNIDLKDKWRNLSVSAGGPGAKEKSKAPKSKAVATPVPAAAPAPASAVPPTPASAPSGAQTLTSASSILQDEACDMILDDPPNGSHDAKNAPKYNEMIFEALSATKDVNGCDISAIVSFIEQRHEVPPNFRRLLSSKLRRLVLQGKLEKIQNCYRIQPDNFLGTKMPIPRQKDIRPRPPQSPVSVKPSETEEEMAMAAAYMVVDAENKSYVAAEAIKEAERVLKMAEETDSFLKFAREVYEICSKGEIALLS